MTINPGSAIPFFVNLFLIVLNGMLAHYMFARSLDLSSTYHLWGGLFNLVITIFVIAVTFNIGTSRMFNGIYVQRRIRL